MFSSVQFFAGVFQYAGNIIHQFKRFLEDVCIDALENVANLIACLIVNNEECIIDMTGAITFVPEEIAPNIKMRRNIFYIVLNIHVSLPITGNR